MVICAESTPAYVPYKLGLHPFKGSVNVCSSLFQAYSIRRHKMASARMRIARLVETLPGSELLHLSPALKEEAIRIRVRCCTMRGRKTEVLLPGVLALSFRARPSRAPESG
jgi:hypothetical protein